MISQILKEHLPALTDTYTYKDFTYYSYNESRICEISSNAELTASYIQLLRCVLRFLAPSCYQNKLWNLGTENGQAVVKFILMFPRLCFNWLDDSREIFVPLETCFHALALVRLTLDTRNNSEDLVFEKKGSTVLRIF